MGKQTDWTGGSKAQYRTRGIHCLSSFKGRVNSWARLRRPGRLVRIGGNITKGGFNYLTFFEEARVPSLATFVSNCLLQRDIYFSCTACSGCITVYSKYFSG